METMQMTQAIREIPLFEGLNESVLQTMASGTRLLVKPRFQYLYLPGDASTEMFFVLEGRVKLGVYTQDFKENIRDILHPHNYFGELALVGDEVREGFAITMGEKNRILAIQGQTMLQAMIGDSKLQQVVMKALSNRLRIAEHRADDLINKDARTRIIDYIKNTLIQRGRKIGYELYLKHGLTQQDIASITGTSRQTVTLVLNELRKSNCIHFTRQSILVRDINKLSAQSY